MADLDNLAVEDMGFRVKASEFRVAGKSYKLKVKDFLQTGLWLTIIP